MDSDAKKNIRKPEWLKVKSFSGHDFNHVNTLLRQYGLNTVCHAANCPNRGECYNSGTATFLIMGPICTRNCTFCNIKTGSPVELDPGEPRRVAAVAKEMKLKHVVVTSVTRDDLADGGLSHFVSTISALREDLPNSTIEILTPDFKNIDKAPQTLIESAPDIFNHNIETVARLYPMVRPGADYKRSLKLLGDVGTGSKIKIKSGLMLGLGERTDELMPLFSDLADSGVSILTIGQYLAPSAQHYPVERYVSPEEFKQVAALAEKAGIKNVVSAPLVRSSYRAADYI